MASVRRVQPLSAMATFLFLLCMASVLQNVSSQGPRVETKDYGPRSNNGGRLPNHRDVLDEDKRVDVAGHLGGGLPARAPGGRGAASLLGDKKLNPNVNPNDMNRGYEANNFNNKGNKNLGYQGNNPLLPADKSQGHFAPKDFGKVPPGQNRPSSGRKQIKIADHPMCRDDARQLCSTSSLSNNFAVLDCLQSDFKKDVSDSCQHVLWEYKKNLTTDIRFDAAASEVCKDALQELSDCSTSEQGTGHRISCLIEHKANITNASCKQFLTKMASIVFSDYRLVYKFADACQADINNIGCGRIDKEDRNVPHSQGKTITCLSEHLKALDDKCKHEIVRIAELQADDYHMDRPLFYACREDRERFCVRTKAGGGKIYKCLYRHKFERDMSTACREKLVVRQSLARESIKVNKAFSDACRQDIKQHKCLSSGKHEFRQAKLSTVLLCLEGKQKEGATVRPECIGELKEIRRSLMEDFKISPNIVVQCASEISENCNGGLHREGKTLHCLMDLARERGRKRTENRGHMSSECRRELETLLREADAGEDYSMDPALQKACQPVVDTACKQMQAGNARVMSCLMEKIGTPAMNDECEERLMEIQYFIARDFKLDPRLFKYCHKDAVTYCHADQNWFNPQGPSNNPIIFSCLYRHQKLNSGESQLQLSRACAFEVKRLMRQRSISVELEPRIEEPCLTDLGQYCSEHTGKGEEVVCLRKHFLQLDIKCRWAVGNFTEDLDKDPTIDRVLMRACTPMIKSFCSDMVDKDDAEPTEIMECLIRHKHSAEMNRKCAVGIEHHQLITMQDIKFSYKFKEACKGDVVHYCGGVHKKSDVIVCLSEIHRNDTLLDHGERLSRGCRKQLRFELFQRAESIDLDPNLKKDCKEDSEKYCANITPGNAMVIECLRKHRKELSHQCRSRLFKRERYEAVDNSVDFVLMTACKSMITLYCSKEPIDRVSKCLKIHRHDPDFDDKCKNVLSVKEQYCSDTPVTDAYACLLKHKSLTDFDPKCRRVVKERQLTHHQDYRLNPDLAKSCRLDIPKFCKTVLPNAGEETHSVEGRVINCLKVKFVARRLSRDCEDHIRGFIKEAALNYRDDPVLAKECKDEIQQYCLDGNTGSENDDDGKVEECLKKKLQEKKITKESCKIQVVRILSESRADVQVDPLLHRACNLDLKHYCYDVIQGEGRQMSCLLNALEDRTVRLQTECRKMLQERVAMWEFAAKVAPPETFGDIVSQVQASKSRNYFLGIILGMLCVIFFGGLFCGRVTKRVAAEVKNK